MYVINAQPAVIGRSPVVVSNPHPVVITQVTTGNNSGLTDDLMRLIHCGSWLRFLIGGWSDFSSYDFPYTINCLNILNIYHFYVQPHTHTHYIHFLANFLFGQDKAALTEVCKIWEIIKVPFSFSSKYNISIPRGRMFLYQVIWTIESNRGKRKLWLCDKIHEVSHSLES